VKPSKGEKCHPGIHLYINSGIPRAAKARKCIANLITVDFKMVFFGLLHPPSICIQIACHIVLSPRLACSGVKALGGQRAVPLGRGSARSRSWDLTLPKIPRRPRDRLPARAERAAARRCQG